MTATNHDIPGWRVTVADGVQPRGLAATVARLADPGRALETIHWGRNYLYSQHLETDSGEIEVVVKQFRNQGWRARWRRRLEGSKAEKSWRVARYLIDRGVRTPEPLLLIEATDPEGPSLFVSRRLAGAFESRYFFRAVNGGTESVDFPHVDVDELLRQLGGALRKMHDEQVWHRDVSVGNLLVSYREAGDPPEISVLDLNRARIGKPVNVLRRIRDLCRLRIFVESHQETFLRAYWSGRERGYGFKRALYRLYHGAFLARNRVKGWIRAPFASLAPRRAHAHIPDSPDGAGARDQVVWDHLSDQPHQHAGRLRRFGVRIADAGAHAREMAACVSALPRIVRCQRRLVRERNAQPSQSVAFTGLGVAVRPWPSAPEQLLDAIADLGVRHVLLRLHPWAESHQHEEALAAELRRRGCELAFSLPQDRDLVRDPARWRAALDELAKRFTPYGDHFQVGQAVNRSKWGVWRYDEYEALVAGAVEAFAPYPETRLLGPAVIDFEYYATAAILNMRWRPSLRLDGVASLLYVDRRGAPENTQLGLDTVGKVTWLKAIAQTARNAGATSWITEVNWPLWEGPHSPAGRKVSVDEESQANYLVRYYLLALCTGLVERVYWWQLIARGYGLVAEESDGSLRRRPSFEALATLSSQLEGATFQARAKSDEGTYLYEFVSAKGARCVVGWAMQEGVRASLPTAPDRVVSRDGLTLEAPAGDEVILGPSPLYLWLD